MLWPRVSTGFFDLFATGDQARFEGIQGSTGWNEVQRITFCGGLSRGVHGNASGEVPGQGTGGFPLHVDHGQGIWPVMVKYSGEEDPVLGFSTQPAAQGAALPAWLGPVLADLREFHDGSVWHSWVHTMEDMNDPVLLRFFSDFVDARLPGVQVGLLPRGVLREQLVALGLTLVSAAQAEVEAGARRGWQQTVATRQQDMVVRVLDLRRRVHADISLTALWEQVALDGTRLRPTVRQVLTQTQPTGPMDERWSRDLYERWMALLQGHPDIKREVRRALLHVELDGLMPKEALDTEIERRLGKKFGVTR